MQRGSVFRDGARAIRGGVVAVALMAASTPALAQATLTGTTIYSTSSLGAFTGQNFWNTIPNDGAFNLFLTTSVGGSFLNPAGTLSTPLSLGSNTFYVYGNPGSALPFFGISLFANGSGTPLVSGFAPANGTGAVSSSLFNGVVGMNPSLNVGVPGGLVPSGPLSTTIDGFQYTLTFFSFNTTGQWGDFVGPELPLPNGQPDYLGQFVITVAPVTVAVTPEPSTVVLTASGLLGIVGLMARRRRAIIA